MALAYVPITLTNNESTATGSGFQQLLLNIDMRAYEPFLNDDLSNVYFSSDSAGSTVINSWLESGNSSTSAATTWWVVTSVAANSTTTIYMQVDLTGTSHRNNTTTGEAPQLSPTYAEYDNGANVFPYYQAWGGLSALPSGWTKTSTPTITFGTESTTIAGASATQQGIYQTNPSTFPFVSEMYGELYENDGSTDFAGHLFGPSLGTGNYGLGIYTTSDYAIYSGGTASLGGGSASTSSRIYSALLSSATASIGQINYTQFATASGTSSSYGTEYYEVYGTTAIISLYWSRTRAYPPNGVMPSVGLGQPTNFPYINTSTNPVEVPDF